MSSSSDSNGVAHFVPSVEQAESQQLSYDSSLPASQRPRSVYFVRSPPQLLLIDQREIPHKFAFVPHSSVDQIIHSIKIMLVRGAPAIGAAGGYAMALAALSANNVSSTTELVELLKNEKARIDAARPTAVNLMWATARLLALAELLTNAKVPIADITAALLSEADELATDDVRINESIGSHGAQLIPPNANILHHCNTGRIATVDYGTALGVIYRAHAQQKNIHVWVDETRPRLQGARLTAWELQTAKINYHLIADNASGLLMYSKRVDVVLFGADRVAANGDVANKIGTYKLAVVAHENKIPVYACVPTSTIDLTIPDGTHIVIEERSGDEVTKIGSELVAPLNAPVFNPAFDVTPHRYLTGIITEEGTCYPPFEKSLKEAKEKAEKRIKDTWEERMKKYLHQ